MRVAFVALALALAACTAQPRGQVTTSVFAAADPATSLAVGERLTVTRTAYPVENEGQDPLIVLQLTHPDGRALAFAEANHAPTHVMAQAAGGPLAQIMGLFGEERPTLYVARQEENQGAPFLCGAEGPHSIGVYEAADGSVQIVGLRDEIGFETRADGTYEALPYSPDRVCARLRFRRG